MASLELQEALGLLLKKPENKICADCYDKNKKVTHVSLNNAVFLCGDCAAIHIQENCPNVSIVRPVASDYWSDEQIGILTAGGGNVSFQGFMSFYDFAPRIFIEQEDPQKNEDEESKNEEEESKNEEQKEESIPQEPEETKEATEKLEDKPKEHLFRKYNSLAGKYWREKL